jgi:2-polyprenyl-3-methyl-5-hydroxy-6-metoxy-1,4-benzoquinol methylase
MSSGNFRNEELGVFKKFNTVKKDCIVCGSKNFALWAKEDWFSAVKCKKCNFIWMRPFVNNVGLSEYYSNYIGKRRTNNALKMKQRAVQCILDVQFVEQFINKGKLLDVGCNGGFFLSAFNKKFQKHGTEIDSTAVEYARKNYSFGKNILCTPLEKAPYKNASFDVIAMRGTIEHVPDPVSSITKVSQLLKKGGYYYITATPNGASLSAEVFRDKWTLFHPVQHIWHFSPATLSKICAKFGLKLIATDFPYLGTPYENVNENVKAMAKAITLVEQGKRTELEISPPFFESMMSLVFQKI